jgi:hypothetical protein
MNKMAPTTANPPITPPTIPPIVPADMVFDEDDEAADVALLLAEDVEDDGVVDVPLVDGGRVELDVVETVFD